MRFLKIIPVFLVVGCVAGGAAVADPNESLRQRAGTACAQMGLDPSEAQYQDCTRTLARSEGIADQRAAIQQSRAACETSGGVPGTPQFANCVLNHDERAGY